jgi:CRISPR-associated protein Csm5
MVKKMETKNLKIETLSPVFIWKGDDYSKFDYTVTIKSDGKDILKIYDVNKLIDDLDKYFKEDKIFEVLDDIEEIMKGNDDNSDIITYLKGKNKNIPINKYKISEYHTSIRDFRHKNYKNDKKNKNGHKKDIKTFINQKSIPHIPYLPGSSIKGAINTALLYEALKGDNEKLENIINSGSLYPNGKNSPNISNGENRYFISDAEIKTNMLDIFVAQRFYIYHIEECKIGDFKRHEKNKKIITKIYVEGLKPYQTVDLKIKCSDEIFDKIKQECNELSLKICEWELDLLNRYKEKGKIKSVYNELIEFYGNLLNNIKNPNDAFFLNIGWGGGYLPKTIYLLAKESGIDFNDIKWKLNTYHKKDINDYGEFPFTRTITRYYNPERGLVYYPFGWVKIEG